MLFCSYFFYFIDAASQLLSLVACSVCPSHEEEGCQVAKLLYMEEVVPKIKKNGNEK